MIKFDEMLHQNILDKLKDKSCLFKDAFVLIFEIPNKEINKLMITGKLDKDLEMYLMKNTPYHYFASAYTIEDDKMKDHVVKHLKTIKKTKQYKYESSKHCNETLTDIIANEVTKYIEK